MRAVPVTVKFWVFFNELELEAPLLDVQVARHWHTIHRGQFLPFSFLLARWRGFEQQNIARFHTLSYGSTTLV